MIRSRRAWAAVSAALIAVLASGCDGGGGNETAQQTAYSSPTAQPSSSAYSSGTGAVPTGGPTTPGIDAQLKAFADRCDTAVNDFRSGQVDYPRTVAVSVGDSATYDAAIDIRSTPGPPAEVIGSGDPTTEPVTVQCLIGARLLPVGGDVDVEAPETADGGWRYQQFTPSGVVEWTWTVTAHVPRDQQVRLEIKPAVKGRNALDVSSSATAAYLTDVRVDASRVERVSYWFETQWTLLVKIAGAIGLAFLGVLAFSQKARDGLAALRRPARRTAGRSAGRGSNRPRRRR